MFEGTQELAENKLLLLYIFDKINHPLSNTNVTEIVLENNLLNYFHLQQYLSELVSSGFLSSSKEEKRQLYSLSRKGKNVLEYFEGRISDAKKDTINNYISRFEGSLEKQVHVTADFYHESDDGYTIKCTLAEGDVSIAEFKFYEPSGIKAKQICDNWNNNGWQIYKKIMQIIMD